MTYSLRDTARSQMKSRLEKIDASERADGSAGTAVSEDYGNKAAGPSSSAKFKRGGVVAGETMKKRLDRPGKPKRASGGATGAHLSDMAERGTKRAPLDEAMPVSPHGDLERGAYDKRKRGGAVKDNDADDTAKRRPDRPHRANGGAVKANKGKTNINIIIAPQGGDKPEMPMPPAPPMAGPPPAPMGPPPAPPIPPQALAALGGGAPPMPMRKRGGAVKMEAGAGSGLGRLDKTEDAKKAK